MSVSVTFHVTLIEGVEKGAPFACGPVVFFILIGDRYNCLASIGLAFRRASSKHQKGRHNNEVHVSKR